MNPFLGVLFHWIGGLAAGSFYLPYKGVKRWSWETYWLVGGIFSWIIAPAFFASLLVPDLWHLIATAPPKALFWTFFFGLCWGVGGLTFGLTMRYLGLALGYAIALGCCAAFGTLIPPIFTGKFGEVVSTTGGWIVLAGVALCLVGIAVSGMAGMSKERELTDEQKKASVKEFHFSKGLAIAIFCGIASAFMAFTGESGKPISALAKEHLAATGHLDVWQNLPTFVIALWGGFLTNFVWCLFLNIKNRSGHEYFAATKPEPATDRPAPGFTGGVATALKPATQTRSVPLALNYLLSATAGVLWYFQFFFYSMGQVKMGTYGFSSWTLHMASIIIFSTLWGVALKEWKGTSKKTHALIATGLALLVASTVIIGYGNFKDAQEKETQKAQTASIETPT